MLSRTFQRLTSLASGALLLAAPASASAADLILSGATLTLGGVQSYGTVSLTDGARLTVPPFNGTDRVNTGNLVIKADSILIDATSTITAKGAGYQAALCLDGPGPATAPLSGGRGGCAVRDSGGGGAHFGLGGRGTKDCPGTGCIFPQYYEENCIGAVSSGACTSLTDCRNGDALPSVAGQPFFHSIYAIEFGAAGGDKGCRDGDGFALWPGTTVVNTGGDGGGRIVLFAANSGQTGALNIAGRVIADGFRGCASGNDSAGGGSGGSILIAGDNVTIEPTARISARGARGGDSQPKCLACTTAAECQTGQGCVSGRCSPCNCTPCTTNAQCNASLGQTCKALGGAIGTVCADAVNQCTPFDPADNESECTGTQTSGTCDDCGGGGGGGIVSVLSRVASISPLASFNVSGAPGGVCPICTGEAGGGPGELQIDGAYVGEVCDGWDNDFNGLIDDGLPPLTCTGLTLPSCVNGLPQQCPANVPACVGPVVDTRPRFVVVVDTSGSMLLDTAGKPTFGDGSQGYSGVDTSTDADVIDGNNSRLYVAKSALVNVLSAFPNADFALARYHQDESVNRSCQTASWFECQKICCSYDDPRDNVAPGHPANGCNLQSIYSAGYPASLNANINIGWANQGDCINYAGSCGAPRRGADFLVGFGKPLQQYLGWIDGKETLFNASTVPGDYCDYAGGGDCELRATGPTPLAGAIQSTQDFVSPIVQCDGGVPCRKYALVLLTDGIDECQGDPTAAASALRTSVPGVTINTYVIGVSTLPTNTAVLNAIAAAGGTNAAFFANDQNSIANAFATIIAASTNYEVCNDLDDNCNGLIDEDFPDKGQPCDDGKSGICLGIGARVCNAAQDGTVCQITTPGQQPGTEVCNGLDDNCNGLIDEGAVCDQCVPTIEVCNNLDDNCNTLIDDNPVDANQPCGVSVGQCSSGLSACVLGVLSCVGEIGAQPEACNGLDDDCDGVTDGMVEVCYDGPQGTAGVGVCHAGSRACTAVPGSGVPSYGACVGQVVPSSEICDGLDNDCNGAIDDSVSDTLGHVTGQECCRFAGKCGTGQCTMGAWKCAGSQIVCDGGNGPTPELCNSVDDDCNGAVDDLPGLGTDCATLSGCPGQLACDTTSQQTVCQATGDTQPELCNGIDDDCDGSIDEEPEVSQNDPAMGKACEAPAAPQDHPPCMAGLTVCKSGALACEGAVKASPELCDMLDNDCDGVADSPEPCPAELNASRGCAWQSAGQANFLAPAGSFARTAIAYP